MGWLKRLFEKEQVYEVTYLAKGVGGPFTVRYGCLANSKRSAWVKFLGAVGPDGHHTSREVLTDFDQMNGLIHKMPNTGLA